eukprot:3753445-Ditylum_brightwellii.AAC.1
MSVKIRLGNVEGSRVKELAGLTDNHMKILKDDYQILLISDLALLDKADIDNIITNDKDTFLKRRKLFAIMIFLRTIEDQENFQAKAEAHIGQIAFKFLLAHDANGKKEQDKELYNVFKNSFHGGKAYNV